MATSSTTRSAGACAAPGVEYRSDGVVTDESHRPLEEGPGRGQGSALVSHHESDAQTPRRAGVTATSTRVGSDIEELFRDAKNEHLGWSLSKTRIKRADRLDRLILILAVAYLLLVALGLWCRRHKPARLWASNNRRHELSAYAIGRVMLLRLCVNLPTLAALSLYAPWQLALETGDESDY